ncbi:MAG: DUF222 domain-containing protein [Actinomycetota bacterium]
MLAGLIPAIQTIDVDHLTRPLLEAAIEELQMVESAAVAKRLAAMGALDSLNDGGLPSDSIARSKGKASSTKAKRDKATATILGNMPKTAQKLANGAITPEHAAAAAGAADQTGDPAAADEALFEKTNMPADLFAKRAKDWANANEPADELERRAQRQRRNRKVAFGRSKEDGSWSLYASTETSEGRELQGLIEAEADRLYREDGGRENPTRERSTDQRRLDALANLLRRGAGQQHMGTGRPHPRYQGVVRIPLESYLDPASATGELIGSGSLPRAVVQRILCESGLDAVIVDGAGNPLWAGRTARTANLQQWRALVERDEGCVVCGADPSRCEAHHLIWWSHHGPTDIDNLVLLCSHCHHELHDHDLDLVKRDGVWQLRANTRAGPEPPRSTSRRRQRRNGRALRGAPVNQRVR